MRFKSTLKILLGTMALSTAVPVHGADLENTPKKRGHHMTLEDALGRYDRNDVSWYNGLDESKKTAVQSLYDQLERGSVETVEHACWLVQSLYRLHHEEDIHHFRFTPKFMDLLGQMPAAEACRFFSEMWLIIPIGRTGDPWKWFDVVTDFFSQLPEDQKNIGSLHLLLSRHAVHISEYDAHGYKENEFNFQMQQVYALAGYTLGEKDADTKVRLRGIRSELEVCAKINDCFNTDRLRLMYNRPAPSWDKFKSQLETGSDQAHEALSIIVVLPFLPFVPPKGGC